VINGSNEHTGITAGTVGRLLAWRPRTDGRFVLVAAIVSYFACIAVGRMAFNFDLWPYLGVPSGPSLFFDARNLTAAWECARLGADPLYTNPCDPWGRPLMYLRPWLLLGILGLDQSHTFVLGVVLVAAMFLSFAALVGRVPAGTGLLLAVAACSPAVMFAVERANMDIGLFSIVTAAVLLWRASPAARVVSPALVLLAATAKIYPVFALPAFVVSGSRLAARAALISLAAFVIYVAASLRDVAHVAEIATQGQHFSYGARILPAHLYHQVGAERWAAPAALKQLIAVVPLALAAAVIAIGIHRRMAAGASTHTPQRSSAPLLALHIGALIYLGTFATANNFDYRLVYLLLPLPQLAEWARAPGHRLSSLAQATLGAIIVVLWVGSASQWLSLWDELASWGVAGLLTAVVAVTLPPLRSVRESVLGGGFEMSRHS
jgi:hypothetical protein